jgi:hypothetical protein
MSGFCQIQPKVAENNQKLQKTTLDCRNQLLVVRNQLLVVRNQLLVAENNF